MTDSIEDVSIVTLTNDRANMDAQVTQDAHILAAAFREREISCEVGIAGAAHNGQTYLHIFMRGARPAPFEVTDIFNKTAPLLTHTTGARFRKHTTEWVQMPK